MIIDFGLEQYGVEIKSSKTIQEKHFNGLKYWMNLTGKKAESMYLIYSGNADLKRNNFNVVGWDNVFGGDIKKRFKTALKFESPTSGSLS